MQKNIAIIHYNTPKLTECLVKSINKFVDGASIYILDNSDKNPFTSKFDNVTIIDNTKGQIVNFDKWVKRYPNRRRSHGKVNGFGSAKHAYSVEKCMEIIGKPFVLMDSDILLKRDISNLFMDDCVYVGQEITQPMSTINRLLPFVLFINTDKCKEKNIHFFDDERMHGLYKTAAGDRYDTGASFWLDAHDYKHKDIDCMDYCVHYGHGSWVNTSKKKRKAQPAGEWLNEHWSLWTDKKPEKPKQEPPTKKLYKKPVREKKIVAEKKKIASEKKLTSQKAPLPRKNNNLITYNFYQW